MKTNLKVLSSAALASALAVPAVAGVAPQTVDAAESIDTIAFQYDGDSYTVSYADYAEALLDGEGELYDVITSDSFSVAAVGIGDGEFVKYDAVATAKLDNPETSTLDLLEDLAAEDENLVDEDTVDSWKEIDLETGEEPAVESVEALNLKQASVELSGDFDEETAEDVESYTVVDSDDDEYALASADLDGDTVTLTFEDAVPNQSNLSITVESELVGEDYTAENVKFFDTTPPEVNGVEAIGSNAVRVDFSEPMKFGSLDSDNMVTDNDIQSAFELNDGDTFVSDVKVLDEGTSAIVYFYSDLEDGDNQLTVTNDLTDYAGYITTTGTVDFSVEEDETAPELVEIKDLTPLKATYVFSEAVDEDTIDKGDFYHTNTSLKADSVEEVNGNEVTVKWKEDDALPNGTAYLYVAAESVKDLWGNENSQQLRMSAEVEVDEAAPTVKEIKADSEKVLLITYSEEVTTSTATDEDNYEITDENGDEVDIQNIEATDEDNQFKVTLESNTPGDIEINIDGVSDIYGNEIDDLTKDFFVGDTTNPVISNFTSSLYDKNESVQSLVITFDGEMMATDGEYSVLDLSKYEIKVEDTEGTNMGVTTSENLDDLDGVDITAINSGKQVRIDLDTSDAGYKFFTGNNNVTMARVADEAGNVTTTFSDSFNVTDGDTGKVGLDSEPTNAIVATDKETVEISLNDTVTSVDEGDFTIYEDVNNDTTYTAGTDNVLTITGKDLDNSGSNSVITFTLDDELSTSAQLNSHSVYVNAAGADGANTANEFGEEVKITSEKVADSISPELDASVSGDDLTKTSDDEYELTRDSAKGLQTLDITFTENVTGSAQALGTYLDVEGYTFVTKAQGDLEDGEFTIADNIDGTSNTVTVYVYTDENDEFTIELDPNRFLEDNQGNDAEFQDTITVKEN